MEEGKEPGARIVSRQEAEALGALGSEAERDLRDREAQGGVVPAQQAVLGVAVAAARRVEVR